MFFRSSGMAGACAGRWRALLLAVSCGLFLGLAASVFGGTPGAAGSACSDNLPAYNFQYKNGLYATIVGFLSVQDVELKDQKTYKLKIDSFKKKVPVRAIIQRGTAPLVVVLLGIDGQASGRLGKLWPSWYAQAGYHVLTFDSTFLPPFIEMSGHGVTGNLVAESDRVKEIIAAFLEMSEIKGKVSKIGVVGMSYGGIEALVLGREAKAGKLPFKLDGIQAYSPPVRLQKTGELIDRWYHEDRWNYTLVELADELSSHKPVPPDSPVPFSDSLMRAGIAAAFRLGLVDVIVRNDRMYKLRLLPSGNNFDDEYVRRDYAGTWGYSQFMEDAAFPYWQRKLKLGALSDLMGPIELGRLLPQQPECAEVVLAADDPFNTAEDLADLKTAAKGANLTVLPCGGHLGFVTDAWTRAKLLAIFEPATRSTTCRISPGGATETK